LFKGTGQNLGKVRIVKTSGTFEKITESASPTVVWENAKPHSKKSEESMFFVEESVGGGKSIGSDHLKMERQAVLQGGLIPKREKLKEGKVK